MPKASPGIFAFNSGLLTTVTRPDIEKYARGCRVLENFIPKVQGPVLRRSGTRFVEEAKDQLKPFRFIPFEFSVVQVYMLVFGDFNFRVYRDGARVPLVEVTTPYPASEVSIIQDKQSADALYLAHPNFAPQKIERLADDDWIITEILFDWPPFTPLHTDDTTMFVDAATGTGITVTASTAVFKSGHVGGWLSFGEIFQKEYPSWSPDVDPSNWVEGAFNISDRAYNDGRVYELDSIGSSPRLTGHDPPIHEEGIERDQRAGWQFINWGKGYGKITAVAGDGLSCTLDVDTDGVELPETVVLVANETKEWRFSAFSAENGFPVAVSFSDDRLIWGGTVLNPQTVWASRTGDFEDYRTSDEATGSLLLTLNVDDMNAIEWIIELDVLTLGTQGGAFTIQAGTQDAPLTPNDARAKRRARVGTRENLNAVAIDSAILFVQRAGEKLHEMTFDFDTQRFSTPNMNDLNEEILESGVKWMAFQREPFRTLWVGRGNGKLCGFAYEREQGIAAWFESPIAGTDVDVETGAAIPHPDKDQDQLWLGIKRTIDGNTVRYIEILERPWRKSTDIIDAFFVDSGLTADAPATTDVDRIVNFDIGGGIIDTIVFAPSHGLITGQCVRFPSLPNLPAFEDRVFVVGFENATQFFLLNLDGTSVVEDVDGPVFGGTVQGGILAISGLDHLEGETVTLIMDGATHPDRTVSGGSIDVEICGFKAQVGLRYASRLKPMALEAGAADGTAKGKTGRIDELVVDVEQCSEGLKYGDSFDNLFEVPGRDVDDLMDTPVPLQDGQTGILQFDADYTQSQDVCLEHDVPLPCTIRGIFPQLTVNDR